jgi:hypothetical protein
MKATSILGLSEIDLNLRTTALGGMLSAVFIAIKVRL